jgi:uncharacterized protein (TIGR02466 family)
MAVEGWFATPIYWNMVRPNMFDQIQTELESTEKTLRDNNVFKNKPTWEPGTHQLSDITFEKNLISEFNLKTLEDEIYHHIILYKQEIGMPQDRLNDFGIYQSWMTNTRKNEYAHSHNHTWRADISGVYYYKTNGNDGSILFKNPIPQFESPLLDHIPNEARYHPQNGKILLFPGWLYHSVSPNYTDDDRLSVSFNIAFKKENF